LAATILATGASYVTAFALFGVVAMVTLAIPAARRTPAREATVSERTR
jgi:hypothetical protein